MLPKVHILGTGGSISGIGPHRLDYTLYPEAGKKLCIEQLLARIPEARELAELSGEDLLQVGSPSIGPAEWLKILHRIQATPAAIVITHGTATLEETAYFLHLTVKSARPVVITGAMRPPSAVGNDADLNLLDAIRLAASPEDAGRGVLTILNNEIQSARDVTKSNAFRVDTFHSRDFGLLGYVDSDARVFSTAASPARTPPRRRSTSAAARTCRASTSSTPTPAPTACSSMRSRSAVRPGSCSSGSAAARFRPPSSTPGSAP